MLRASLSVVLNIAEGSGKASMKDLSRFLDISLGSLYETLACTDTLAYNKLIDEKESQEFEKQIVNISSQLGGFKKKLKATI